MSAYRENQERELLLLIIVVLVLLAIVDCAHGGIVRPARVGDPDTRMITAVIEPVSLRWWRNAPWYDPVHDTQLPFRVIIADRWACVQYTSYVDNPRASESYKCLEGWRSGPHAARRK